MAACSGLGELAGYNLPDEHPGAFPTEPPAFGGVARMSSFGEGIQITPLQLAALAAAFANGGTLYYLQYPHSQEEVDNFEPRVKRDLNIASVLPEVREGMLAAVLYGTGRLSYDAGGDETPLGKTGTATTTPILHASAGSLAMRMKRTRKLPWLFCFAGIRGA